MRKFIIGLIGIVILGLITSLIYYKRIEYEEKGLNYIILSVNPEIELVLNQDNKVKEIIGLDDAGDLVLSDINLKKLDLETSLAKIVVEMIKTGYLNDYNTNIIVATVISSDEDTRLKLESEVAKILESSLIKENITGIVAIKSITEQIQTSAIAYNISNGKMLLIEKAIELNTSLKESSLTNKTMYQINKYIKLAIQDRIEKSNQTIEELRKAKSTKIEQTNNIKATLEFAYKLQNKLTLNSKTDEEVEQLMTTHLKNKKAVNEATIKRVVEKLKSDNNTSSEKDSYKYISIKEKTEELVKDYIQNIIKSN